MSRPAAAQTMGKKTSDRRKLEAGLDEALAQTFPASDPFSVGQFTANEPPVRPIDRKAPKVDPRN